MPAFDGVRTTYTTPGLRFPVLRATDDQGVTYLATAVVNVLSVNQIDGLLRAKWNGMKAALKGGALDVALGFFALNQQARYSAIFAAVLGNLPQIAADMEEIELVQVRGRTAQYRIGRTQEWGGQSVRVAYYIFFVLGVDGVWRIWDF